MCDTRPRNPVIEDPGVRCSLSAAEPRLRLSSIVHDFNSLLTPVLTILEELQGRRVGTSRQL